MVNAPELGSRAKVTFNSHNGEVEHIGLILPPTAPKHITIKLDNGYNVSFPTEAMVTCEVLTPPVDQPPVELNPPNAMSDLPRVRLIHTGGTIASKVDYATGAVDARFEPDELLDALPELADIAQLDAVKIGNMFSDDIRPQHWNLMAQACADAFADGCRGVVIAHGTDTLHISSAALSFAFSGMGGRPAGPIAMVGSQRSSDRGSSDATENLLAAVHWAAHAPLPTGHCGDSVVVVMHATSSDGLMAVHSGLAVRKMPSSRRDAFNAVNAQPIAHVSHHDEGWNIETMQWYQHSRNEAEKREVNATPSMY